MYVEFTHGYTEIHDTDTPVSRMDPHWDVMKLGARIVDTDASFSGNPEEAVSTNEAKDLGRAGLVLAQNSDH